MSQPPYFSILLPTKNRSHLVGYAIRSVLQQDFTDFELIICDNDDDPDATRRVVERFSDSRIKYIRTGGLSMPENWEFALDQARGEYVTVLEDKQAYYPWALEHLNEIIESHAATVVIWEWDVYDDKQSMAFRKPRSGDVKVMETDRILKAYVEMPWGAWSMLPRMLNSVALRDTILRIRDNQNVKKFFSESSPDLCAAFYLLGELNTVHFCNDGLGLLGYMHESNARKISSKKGGISYYGGGESAVNLFTELVPIKSYRLVHNTVYNDFLRIRRDVGGRLKLFEMSAYVYAKLCARDLVMRLQRGGAALADWMIVFRYTQHEHFNLSQIISLMGFVCIELVKPYLRWMRGRVVKAGKGEQWAADNILLAASSAGSKPVSEPA